VLVALEYQAAAVVAVIQQLELHQVAQVVAV
jgi:hypothetical protein